MFENRRRLDHGLWSTAQRLALARYLLALPLITLYASMFFYAYLHNIRKIGPISLEAEMTWLQYAALTWQPAFSIGIIPCTDDGEKWSMTHANTFIFNLNNPLGGGHSSEDHGSTSESLNIYPEACGGENSDMLESARLSVSLEGDENFRVSFSIILRLLKFGSFVFIHTKCLLCFFFSPSPTF